VTASATILAVIASVSARRSTRATAMESIAQARRRTVFRAFGATVAATAIVAVDLLARRRLPEGISALLPALTFAAGIMVSRRPVGREHPEASAIDNAKSKIDRAAVELENLSIGALRPMAPDDAMAAEDRNSRKEDGEVLSFRAAASTNAGVEYASEELGKYHLFTEILSRQMVSVSEISEEAAKNILANLTQIDSQNSALVSFIKQSGSSEQVAKVVALIESQMTGCQVLLKRFVDRQQADAQDGAEQRSKVVAETQGVQNLLENVDAIARQTRMLSFNVSIEAAHAGDFGRGFSVIGDEIRKLASEVQELSKAVRERVETLTETITKNLQQESEQREQAEHDAVAKIAETLSALSGNLMTLVTHQRDTLSKVESENESIAQPVMDAMGNIQFQDIVRQQLKQLISMAEMVSDHMRTIGAALDEPRGDFSATSLSQKLDGQFGSYVMERQFTTHLSAQGQAVTTEAVASIELF
jgi:methyl-accepting chemotaxis protein